MPDNQETKLLTIPVSKDLHTKLKMKSVKEDKTMKSIVQDLLRKELEPDNEKEYDDLNNIGIDFDDIKDR